MSTVTKFLHAPDASLSGKAMTRPALALLGVAGKVWEAASPIVAKGCLAAMVQPSPTTGFVIGVALEIGRQLLRNPAMAALLLWAQGHIGRRAGHLGCRRTPAICTP